jgi:hypothetical protein
MDKDFVTIVSGLPRSGTSMVMKMLEAGGIPPLTDNIRTADIDNPKGYYEFERVKKLPEDTDWLKDARGKAVKVLAELVKHLPDGYTYKIVFIQRNLEEIIQSQKKMLIRRGENPNKVSDKEIFELYSRYLKILKAHINKTSNMEVLYIDYNKTLQGSEETIKELNEFFDGKLNVKEMTAVIDKNLYRNRAE